MYDLEKMDRRLVAYVEIFLLANRLQTVMNTGIQDITAKQWLPLIMLRMFDNPPTLKDLSEVCGISHQSTKQLVLKLQEKGFVNIEPDKNDRRAIRISGTEKCSEWIEKYAIRNYEFVFEVFSGLTGEEIESLHAIQNKLYAKLGEMYKEIEKNEC